MSNSDEDILTLLIPIFCEYLEIEEIIKLAKTLSKKKFIIPDVVNQLDSYVDKTEKIKALFQSLVSTSAKAWKIKLREILEWSLEQDDLSKITEAALGSNENVIWILHSWSKLSANEDAVRMLANFLEQKELPSEGWLLEFLSRIASADESVAGPVIGLLKTKVSPSLKSTVVAEKSSKTTKTDVDEEPPNLDDVNELFLPLAPFLADCMDSKQVVTMINSLKNRKYLSEGQTNALMSENCFSTTTFKSLAAHIQSSAKISWRKDVLECIQSSAHQTIFHIAQKQLDGKDKDDDFHWMITNWTMLMHHEHSVKQTAEEKLNYRWTRSKDEFWLPNVIIEVSNSTEKKSFVDALKLEIERRQIRKSQSTVSSSEMSEGTASTLLHQEQSKINTIRENLLPLLPMLTDCLKNKDIITLAKELMLKGHLSQESMEEIKQSEESSMTLKKLVEMLALTTKAKWQEDLVSAIQCTGHQQLSIVVQKYFFGTNTEWKWFAFNWRFAMAHGELVKNAAEKLMNKECKFSQLSFIEDVLLLLKCASNTEDSVVHEALTALTDACSPKKKVQKAKETVQKAAVVHENLHATPDLHTEPAEKKKRTNHENRGSTVEPSIYFNEIQDTVDPLLPLLMDCLKNDIIQVIDQLKKGNHVLEGSWEQSDAVKAIFSSFKYHAKENWKRDFLDALEQCKVQGVEQVFHVVAMYMDSKIAKVTWKWFVNSWTVLIQHTDILKQLVEQSCENVCLSAQSNWVLGFIVWSSNAPDEEVKRFIEKFRTQLGEPFHQRALENKNADADTHQLSSDNNLKRKLKEAGEDISQSKHPRQVETDANADTDEEDEYQVPPTDMVGSDKKVTTCSDGENYAEPRSYLSVAKGGASKGKSQHVPPEAKLSEKPASVLTYDHYRNPLGHCKEGEYLMEFQAVIVDPVGETDKVCVYMKREHVYYPMHYNRRGMYTFLLPTSERSHTYKYCILRNGKTDWEHLPATSSLYVEDIRDRQRTFSFDHRKTGHVIAFDVVTTKHVNHNIYQDLYEGNLLRLMPSFENVSLKEEDEDHIPYFALLKMYSEFFMSQKFGLKVLGAYFSDTTVPDIKKEDYWKFMTNEVQRLTHNSAKRVLATLAFCIAMEVHFMHLDSVLWKNVVCYALSMHDVNDEEQSLILNEIDKFEMKRKRYNPSLLDTRAQLRKILVRVSNVPECLLLLPLLKLLENAEIDSCTKSVEKPALPNRFTWRQLKTELRDAKHQDHLVDMSSPILHLIKSFPWIREMYQEVLSLKTASDLLSGGVSYYQLFDIGGILNKLWYFWNELFKISGPEDEKILEELLKYLFKTIGEKSTIMMEMEEISEPLVKECTCFLEQSINILNKVASYADRFKYVRVGYIEKSLAAVSCLVEMVHGIQQKGNGDVQHALDMIQNGLLDKFLKTMFVSRIGDELDKNEVELWNFLITFRWSKPFQKKWYDKCQSLVLVALPKKFSGDAEKLLNFFTEKFEALNPDEMIASCFTEMVTKHVEESLQVSKSSSNVWSSKVHQPKMRKICMKLINKQWRKVQESLQEADHASNEQLFRFLFEWTPAVSLIKLLSAKGVKEHVNEDTLTILEKIKADLKNMVHAFLYGKVTAKNLKKVAQNRKTFVDVYEVLWKGYGDSVDVRGLTIEKLGRIIEFRLAQLEVFYAVRLAIEEFLDSLNLYEDTIKVNVTDLDEKVRAYISHMRLCDLIYCGTFKVDQSVPKKVDPRIQYFDLTKDEIMELMLMSRSNVLSNPFVQEKIRARTLEFAMALETPQTEEAVVISLQQFLQEIWFSVKNELLQIAESINKGTILLREIDVVLESSLADKENGNTSIKEMVTMFYELRSESSHGKIPEQRISQLQNYRKLKMNQKVYKAIHEIRTQLKLSGKFPLLDKALNLEEGGDTTLVAVRSDVVKASQLFKGIPMEKCTILVDFIQHQNLIDWLKDNMKNIGEVKVMSDLALISAGETPMEVDRVSCFLSAVMGFSPLLFDLHSNSGWPEFYGACKQVWSNVLRDSKLPDKWRDTANQLEWLKATKDFHGSVERSSLTRAKLINESGMYVVGGKDSTMPSLEESLSMEITKKLPEKQPELIKMNLPELRDLQSRLMLIAGEAEQGRQDVNRFIDVLSAVEKLAKTYIKLKRSGCMLFTCWKSTIRCNDTDGNVTVSVFFDENAPAVSSGEKVIEEVQKLTTVLEEALNEWKSYLDEKRSNHYHLNHFSIHQITYLCKNLANSESIDGFPDQVYCLLKFLVDDPSYETVLDALDLATRIADTEEQEDVELDVSTESNLEKKKKIVRSLVQSELAENVAKAAVQASRSLDPDDCYLWALENEFDEEKVTQLQKDFDAEIGFAACGNKIEVVRDVINDRLNLTLVEVIKRIQDSLENDSGGSIGNVVKTVCERYFKGTAVTSLSDCVSLEHLGEFLTILCKLDKCQTYPKRQWSDVFICGQPNLIICAPDIVWRTILSIYTTSSDQPLPSTTEVLICSENTTGEDVELLLRRAVITAPDKGERIYCLACADQLSFTVSHEVELMFHQLVQMSMRNETYRLVILASSQHHYITSIFDEYQVSKKMIPKEQDLRNYIAKHLEVAKEIEGSVAQADKNRSCVRLVCSEAAGMGKSLYIQRRREEIRRKFKGLVFWHSTVLRFLDKSINVNDVIAALYEPDVEETLNGEAHFIHVDITPSVEIGAYKFLFNLIILGSIENDHGFIWRRCPEHFYAIEYTLPTNKGVASFANLLELLPTVTCLAPSDVRDALQDNHPLSETEDKVLMDLKMLQSPVYQRPFQYLLQYKNNVNLDNFSYQKPEGTAQNCLETLLQFCHVKNPSWSALCHFSSFLNVQLQDCENSIYCNFEIVGEDSFLQGFKQFVVKFMIRMSQDFATPSLSGNDHATDAGKNLYGLHQLRRRWESVFHPYLFFNDDGGGEEGLRTTMSFVHFNISKQGHLCHPVSNAIIQQNVMEPQLFGGLVFQRVSLQQNFDELSRASKLQTLCAVFGVQQVFDPDPSYELTTDNVLKMLAIHMRFRCDIPVIIMGETGCGKTRMVEFMSRLKAGKNCKQNNMVIVKVHGGVTVSIIQQKVREAVQLAEKNRQNGNLETILFLDEANTTEAIYAIKEVMCDRTVHGKPFNDSGLKIVAACNPYRKHSEDVIQAMEKSGLGFNIKAAEVKDKFAGIPMRYLVYRVIPLPPSMQPLVWDFGQLNNDTEKIYIRQMVLKLKDDIHNMRETHPGKVPQFPDDMVDVMTAVLAKSQCYMRERRGICSFVSLRDVERTILSFKWFYLQKKLLNQKIDEEKVTLFHSQNHIKYAVRALIQSIGMCYHATLEDRRDYRVEVATSLAKFNITQQEILHEIIACQNVFINSIKLEKDIARNEALRENVFMMIVCAEMRIPLFLVGKPGSSKSLAKTIVTDAMQGRNSRSHLFQNLKQIQVLSFQCSAVSDAVGIETIFTQCAQLQKKQELDKYVAVVVLDEIGLAEDSPKMPLKVLHPLLEVGSTTHSGFEVQPHNKVGFVGISNWALDPAKMNRGIFVTRGKPSEKDLHKTAEAIFRAEKSKIENGARTIKAVTAAYLQICQEQEQEFFGLRDYYGLLKMIYRLVSHDQAVKFYDIAVAILRNFSGGSTDTFVVFQKHLEDSYSYRYHPNVSVVNLIEQNLQQPESRFLLLLTKQYSAVSLLSKVMGGTDDFQVIFGSSFPRDNDYTEVCRNINKIKVCMESGKTVVLLNLRDLYESLYDALNQHYVTFAGQRYVDLGLGGHRVKCRIAENFRLIVIEEREIVYKEFPIPLINRLEKHVFEMNSVLIDKENDSVNRLKEWVHLFTDVPGKQQQNFTIVDCFAGYQDDTAASAVLSVASTEATERFEKAKHLLLETASVDAVARLAKSKLGKEVEQLQQLYNCDQAHGTFSKLLLTMMNSTDFENRISVHEVTSFSVCLNEQDRIKLETLLKLPKNRVKLLTLQQLQTEEEYNDILNEFFTFACSEDRDQDEFCVLLIQCPQAQQHTNLIACAKYCAINKVKEIKTTGCKARVILAFVFTLERSTKQKPGSFKSFHSGECQSVYVDELRPVKHHIAPIPVLWNLKVSEILLRGCENSGREIDQQVIDVQHLIQVCIPEAMAKLTNQVANLSRNRVKIMMSLCKERLFSELFQNSLMAHVVRILEDRETFVAESWVVEEACSHSALQEGGSFLNTLWLRLKHLVGLALAKVTSIADIDQNLDLICKATKETAHIANLWFAYFNSKMCRATWSEVSHGNDFTVQTQSGHHCLFPFSHLVIDELCKNWSMADHLTMLNKKDGFVQKMENSWISPLLDKAMDCNGGQQQDVIKRFTNDLVKILYKPLSNDTNQEEEAIKESILILFKVKREDQTVVFHNALLEVFMVLKELQPELQLLGEIMASCTEIFKFCPQWLNEQRRSPTFVLPIYAFQSVLQYLEEEAANLGKLESCQKWKELVCRMKRVADPILAKHASTCPELNAFWKQIKFVELFLDQLVVRSSLNVEDYIKTLAPLARRLWKGASKVSDLADVQFLNIVTKTLQGCTKDIYLKLLCSWSDTRCRVCKTEKFNKPVLLPCGHYLCSNCVTQGGDSTCPVCRKKLPNTNALKPLQLSKDQKKEYELFKSATTSFLLEYLSTFCFPSPEAASQEHNLEPPNEKILLALEKLVICKNKTHKISPFHSAFDVHPTARSYILQLLLRCDKTLVKGQLDHHFDSMTAVLEDKEILMDIYLQCSHDMLVNRLHSGDDVVNTDFVEEVLFQCIDLLNREKTFSQMDNLEFSSQLQYVASITAQCIHLLHTKDAVTPKQRRAIKPFIERLCAACDDPKMVEMKQYLVKCLCRRHGTDSFDILLQEETYRRNLVPQNLIPQEDTEEENFYLHSDAFVLCGESYIKTKDLLFEVTQKEDVEELVRRLIHEIQQSQDSVFQIMLAVSVWAARGIASRELREEVVGRINQRLQMHLTGKVHQPLFKDIATKELDVFKNKKHSRRMQYKLTELITMAGLVFLGCGEGVLTSLRDFITNPQSLVRSFIPTMPASNFFEVREVMQLERSHHTSPKAYKCPNGHVYFIGECTNPVQAGVCPDCGKKIGGQNYGLLHEGNTAGEITEESQTGYLLEPPEKRLNATPERNMTKLSVCATRICLHAAMLLGSRNGNAIKMMVKEVANKRNTHEFLLAQLTKDLEQVAQCSGKSVDDAILLMHHVLNNMRKYKAQGNIRFGLQSMNARKEWEIEFQRQFLSLVFKNTEMVINQAQQVINDAGKGAVRPLQRLVHELSLKKKLPQGIVKWNCANLWKYRTHVDVQHLKLRLEAVDEKTAGDGAVLKVLLNLEHVNLIPRLTTILAVQSAFIAKYRQKVDISDTDKFVLQDFVAESGDQWEEELRVYIDVWNKVRKTLPGFDRYNTLRRHFDETMTLNSPISMCLPCDRGRGCCALVLAEYLIDKQNTLLNKSRELITPNPTFEQVDASSLTVNQLVCINEKRDLLPLILANSQYEATMTEAGPQHSITYNLGLLERKVEENFILRKCIVKKETIPRMTYPQDVGLGKDSQTVKDKYPQDPLSPRMCQAVDAAVANARTADICEAVRTITLIIQFLAKLGGEMEQTICDYAEKDLLLPTDETAMIPRAAKVCHCLALYERLSWHRSLRSIANGQNPFELVSTNTDKEMTKPLLDQLTPVFQQINVEELQFELNSLMLVGPELQEDWSLSDALLYYMESKYDEKKCTWCRKLPSEILVKHAQHVFTASMKLKAS